MFDQSCIFCKIIQRTIKATVVRENDHVIVIEDISPKAPTHFLIIPKKHIINIATMQPDEKSYALEIITMAHELSRALSIENFNLISNNGAGAGQSVFHMHMHFLAGKNLYHQGLQL